MSLACCNRCGRTFEYRPIPGFLEEFHYCDKEDCVDNRPDWMTRQRPPDEPLFSPAIMAYFDNMPRFQFGFSEYNDLNYLNKTVDTNSEPG